MPNDQLARSIERIELLIDDFYLKNGIRPITVMLSDNDENQSYLMWACLTLGLQYERTTKQTHIKEKDDGKST